MPDHPVAWLACRYRKQMGHAGLMAQMAAFLDTGSRSATGTSLESGVARTAYRGRSGACRKAA